MLDQNKVLRKHRFQNMPYLDEPAECLEFNSLGNLNTVMCWPSVGGMIVNSHASSVELDILQLSRFESVPRSYNVTEQDSFCRQFGK